MKSSINFSSNIFHQKPSWTLEVSTTLAGDAQSKGAQANEKLAYTVANSPSAVSQNSAKN